MLINPNRLLISGTSSGSGKTTITCGILQALKNRQIKVSSFKCGPDYIDPMFHKRVLNLESNNLDSFFCDEKTLINILHDYSLDISIIEGVMGFYDGSGEEGLTGSTYELSNTLKTNTVLIVNCKGISTSIIPIIKGFVNYKKNYIKGIILNNITKNTYDKIKILFEKEFQDLILLGFLPKLEPDLILESRHLGLKTAYEIKDLQDKMDKLANIIEENINLDLLIDLAKQNTELEYQKIEIEKIANVKIGIAYDEAFNFYYNTNLDLLKKMGAELIYFSPLHDQRLPKTLDALYLGGGYPELYKDELSNNQEMIKDIYQFIKNNGVVIAECGGFMYLNKMIEDKPMVNIFDSIALNQHKLVRFGYLKLKSKEDNLILKKDEIIKAHEFHYYDVENAGNSFEGIKNNGKIYDCGFSTEYMYAGFPHLYFYSNLETVKRIIRKASKKC